MTIVELQTDESLRRKSFPAVENALSLNHASACALPRVAMEAMSRQITQAAVLAQDSVDLATEIRATRGTVARMIGSEPGEIALMGPTSMALSLVASSLKFRRGDQVLIYFDDFPSNVYPWLNLSERGVAVRFLNVKKLGEIRPVDVLGQVDENTRLVVLSTCHFLTGYRIDLEAIGKDLATRGILFGVDAIQTAGAFSTPARCVDFMAAGAHKWMLGPCGTGFLFVSNKLSERLVPQCFGWNNVKHTQYAAHENIEYRSNAGRFEPGTPNLAGIAGFRASLEMILEIGIDSISKVISTHRDYLGERLLSMGWEVLNYPANPLNTSGILSFSRPDQDLRALQQWLATRGVGISYRQDRSQKGYLRVSPHFYNSREDLDRLIGLLAKPHS